jgi:hypothetical protein
MDVGDCDAVSGLLVVSTLLASSLWRNGSRMGTTTLASGDCCHHGLGWGDPYGSIDDARLPTQQLRQWRRQGRTRGMDSHPRPHGEANSPPPSPPMLAGSVFSPSPSPRGEYSPRGPRSPSMPMQNRPDRYQPHKSKEYKGEKMRKRHENSLKPSNGN